MNTLLTNYQKNVIFDNFIDMISSETSNVYLGIGRVPNWAQNGSQVLYPDQSTDTINDVYKNLVALKKITAQNMTAVIRRRDWEANVVYDMYDNTLDMFSTTTATSANGTVNVSSGSSIVVGTNSNFTSTFNNGDILRLNGDGSEGSREERQVVTIANSNYLTVDVPFTQSYVSNVAYKIEDTYPEFALDFYVRNSKDQVFKCLYNKMGDVSTEMPELTIGGNLPESVFIETGDGYKWKYLYTIDSASKRKFFTAEWMPVLRNYDVANYATSGSIDILKIVSSGTGYNSNQAAANANILTISGDGTGARYSAKVNSSGSIYDINTLDVGSGYTYATIAISGVGGSGANLIPVISPQNGHGYDPVYELGAGNILISVDLEEDENDTIPVEAAVGSDVFDYHQICMIKDPLLTDGTSAIAINYDLTTKIETQGLAANTTFRMDELVYQGSVSNQTFKATVVKWDPSLKILHVINPIGSISFNKALIGEESGITTTVNDILSPLFRQYSGKILYINNTAGIIRSSKQTEQIRLAISLK